MKPRCRNLRARDITRNSATDQGSAFPVLAVASGYKREGRHIEFLSLLSFFHLSIWAESIRSYPCDSTAARRHAYLSILQPLAESDRKMRYCVIVKRRVAASAAFRRDKVLRDLSRSTFPLSRASSSTSLSSLSLELEILVIGRRRDLENVGEVDRGKREASRVRFGDSVRKFQHSRDKPENASAFNAESSLSWKRPSLWIEKQVRKKNRTVYGPFNCSAILIHNTNGCTFNIKYTNVCECTSIRANHATFG